MSKLSQIILHVMSSHLLSSNWKSVDNAKYWVLIIRFPIYCTSILSVNNCIYQISRNKLIQLNIYHYFPLYVSPEWSPVIYYKYRTRMYLSFLTKINGLLSEVEQRSQIIQKGGWHGKRFRLPWNTTTTSYEL